MNGRLYLLGAVVLWAMLPSGAEEQPDAVVVGCPLAVKYSYGQNALRSLTLAAEEINAAGGIELDGRKRPLRLEILDTDDLNPNVSADDAMRQLRAFLAEKRPDVLVGGPVRSEYGLAAMDVVAEHEVVHLVCAGCITARWDRERFASDPKKYRKSFRLTGSVGWYIQEAADLLRFLKKQYGFQKMFLLIQDALMARDAAELVKTLAEKDGWIIVGKELVPSETTDFRDYLKACRTSGAQLLFLWNYSPNTARLFEQWHAMEIPALPMGFVEAAEDANFWEKTRGSCAYSVITLSEAGTTPCGATTGGRKFHEVYLARWGEPPRSLGSVAGYEALYVLKDAAERANSLHPDKLIPALEKTDLPVVRGRMRFDANHQCVYGYDPKASLLGNWVQWRDTRRVTIWPPAIRMEDVKIPPFLQWYWLHQKTILAPHHGKNAP